jgi:hypothetical protein
MTSTGPLLGVLANCVSKVKAEGLNSAGDFAMPKPVTAKSDAPNGALGEEVASGRARPRSFSATQSR